MVGSEEGMQAPVWCLHTCVVTAIHQLLEHPPALATP